MASQHSFGEYVRSLRLSNSIGQREMARRLKISPSYLNDIESNKRDAPRGDLVSQIGEILQADAV
ncbi:MAG: helix-turn-helix transcriptional regulator, partial [Rhodospirillales bacterium]|nr:helix-turn-helix transcriptional regulator [Rhodospirillales bacterium]